MLSRAVVLRSMYSSAAVEPHLRIFTEPSLPSFIDTGGFNFAESIFLYYRAAPGASVDAAFLRASFRRNWSMLYLVRACPNFVLVIFATLMPCARSATKGYVGF